ncbi:hypothetical protein [Rhodococcoides yunnanense]|uniref:hypothetical protein n=1 Tax=Rhodococcoides yunnanense TaxID=278209 RepID=UPI000932F7EE|nr:hypothetical protein [Rhodococcus yunnanensis]
MRNLRSERYDRLTADNDSVRAEKGWTTVALDAALSPQQRAEYLAWCGRQRRQWDCDDVLAVGFSAVIGCAATWFDTTLDTAVADMLGSVKSSDLLSGWERDATRLPIDYTGPGFGGPGHRVRSSGHDLGRPFAALRQIMNGRFEGIEWTDGVRAVEHVELARFRQVNSVPEALVVWAKHLAADVVTPMSLPLPGWTLLYELPWRDARTFAHDVYQGSALGSGLNARSGVVAPAMCVVSTEVVIRTHVHGRAWRETGSPDLDSASTVLRDELLLAAHSLVGAASLGKTVARMVFLEKSPMALRHLNVPLLLRVGSLALSVLGDRRDKANLAAPTWDVLLENSEKLADSFMAGELSL